MSDAQDHAGEESGHAESPRENGDSGLTRREFLKKSSLAVAGTVAASYLSSPPSVHAQSMDLPNPDKIINSLVPKNYADPEVLERFDIGPDDFLWDPEKDWIRRVDWEKVRSEFAGTKLNFAVGAADKESVSARKEPFEKLTGIEVEIIAIPDANFYDKAVTEFISESGRFDATEYFAPWLGDFAEPGFLKDLSYYVEKWDYPLDDFYETYKMNYAWYADEGIFGLPYDCDFQMMQGRQGYFNRQTGENLGPKQPIETYDDLTDYAEQINNPDEGTYGVGLMGARGFWAAYTWFHVAAQYGMDLFNPDWTPAINSDAGLAGLKKLVELTEHGPPGVTSWGWPDNRSAWLGGQLGLNIAWQEQGSQALRYDQSNIVDDDPITLYEPLADHPDARFAPPNIAGSTASVSASARRPEAGFLMCAFYTTASAQALNGLQANGVATGYKNVIQNEKYQRVNPPAEIWAEELPYAWAEPRLPGMFKLEQLLGNQINNVLSGQKDPKAALDSAASQWQRIMNRQGFYGNNPPVDYDAVSDRFWLGEGKTPPR